MEAGHLTQPAAQFPLELHRGSHGSAGAQGRAAAGAIFAADVAGYSRLMEAGRGRDAPHLDTLIAQIMDRPHR